jgi:hypothetical protein
VINGRDMKQGADAEAAREASDDAAAGGGDDRRQTRPPRRTRETQPASA